MDYERTFNEDEAFAYAKRFYNQGLASNHPRYLESRHIVSDVESLFRPALELQVAGLCLLAGIPRNELLLPVSFAFFVVDHLIMGWAATLVSQFRVAFTLSRSAVEASIFEVASVTDPYSFGKIWKSEEGTGGKVLAKSGNTMPDKVRTVLKDAWRYTVSLGHASAVPVLSSGQTVETNEIKQFHIATFGGPNIEPLNEEALRQLAFCYGLAAQAGLEAMETSLASSFPERLRWDKQYSELRKRTKELADSAMRKLQDEENKAK